VFDFAQVRGFGCSISHSRKGRGGKGKDGYTLSAGEAPDEDLARAQELPNPRPRRRAEERRRERATDGQAGNGREREGEKKDR